MVYVDPVGSGDSDLLADGDYAMSRYARFAEAVLDDLGARTGYFLGHSHGGFPPSSSLSTVPTASTG
ncbi:hypothetical protein E4K10_40470 [Streptomyces sp. T1317-0309]|nr:hypothetical protein E4K10_40470 [Streptomyces sp. T1317-0309]